jgi:hypothetical protein
VSDDRSDHHEVIAGFDELLDIDPEVAELFDELLVPESVPHLVASAVHRAVRELRELVPLDIGIQCLQRGVGAVPIESRIRATCDLDVLLRHRLVPQPHGFEGL